jgi:LytR cell envelope-related transcriptional attenuator
MTRGRMLVIGAVVMLAAVAGIVAVRKLVGRDRGVALGDTTSAPQGQRVIVEVLNASGVDGLARRATFLLRDRGFDVVYAGNDRAGRRSETLVIDYTNKPEAADRLARVLGGAQIERGKDTLDRGLDLTVRLGAAYHPADEAFHP